MCKILCWYCEKREAIYGPALDKDGIGWLPNCMYPDCEDRANNQARLQKDARKKADNPKVLKLKKSSQFAAR